MFFKTGGFRLGLVNCIENDEGINDMLGAIGESSESDQEGADYVDDQDPTDDVDFDEEDSEDSADEDPSDDDADSDDNDDSDDTDTDDNPDETSREDYLKALLEKLTDKVTKDDEPEPEDNEQSVYEDGTFDKVVEALELEKEEAVVLQSFMDKLLSQNTKMVVESVMERIPELVTSSVKETQSKEKVRDDFYSEHQDLVGKEKLVSFVAQEVANEGKHKTMKDILNETAKRTYDLLGVKPGKNQSLPERGKKRRPALPKSKTSRKKVKKSTGVDKEIDEMLSLFT